ncbi:MAG TPA: hypothetical protein VGG38_12810 [Acidimicrobiales bacterium]
MDPTRPGEVDPELVTDEDERWGPADIYDDMDMRVPARLRIDDDDVPPAGTSRADWEAQRRAAEEQQERARLEAESEALTRQWRRELNGRRPGS